MDLLGDQDNLPDDLQLVNLLVTRRIEDYQLTKEIGRGSFGTVYVAYHRRNGSRCAIKSFEKHQAIRSNWAGMLHRELDIMKLVLNCPFVVHIKAAFSNQRHIYIVMEHAEGGSFSDIIRDIGKLSEYAVSFYAAELYFGIRYLHSKDVIHRDIKISNLLCTLNGHLKICDFGLSRGGVSRNSILYGRCGTMAVMAPEMLQNVGYRRDVDWYSLGLVIVEMFGIPNPYIRESRRSTRHAVIFEPFPLMPEIYMLPNAKNLVDRLIVTRRLRMASEEIPGHPFFRHLNMEDVEAQRVHPPLLHIHGFGPNRSGNVDEKEVPAVVLEEGEIDEFEDFYH